VVPVASGDIRIASAFQRDPIATHEVFEATAEHATRARVGVSSAAAPLHVIRPGDNTIRQRGIALRSAFGNRGARCSPSR